MCGYHHITHVLVNDPTKGYGIFTKNMLLAAMTESNCPVIFA